MGIYVFLSDTYADWELGYLLPELVQHERKVVTFGLKKEPVRSLGSLTVTPMISLDEIDLASVQALILPGGLFWKDLACPSLDELVRQIAARRVPIAGICAATGYLARLGLLNSIAHTSNSVAFLQERAPNYNGAAHYRNKMAVSDSAIITASGLGAVDFTYELLHTLNIGDQTYQETWYRAFKQGEEPREEGFMSENNPVYYAIVLNKVEKHELSKETIQRHVEHLARLNQEGRLILCGPFADHPSGMIIVKARNKGEATAIAEADPFVSEGARTFEVRTWLIACKENNYLA